MKKTLLFVLMCLCATIGAWAQTTVSLSEGTLTITTTEAGTLSSVQFTDEQKAATTVKLVGQFNAADLQAIKTDGDNFKFTTVDMSGAFFVDAYNYSGRPEGSVTGYEWFSEVPTSAQNTNKIIVGGSLYQATTETTKQWNEDAGNQELSSHWDANIYSELPDPGSFPVGSYIKIAQGSVSYVYYQKVDDWNWGNSTTVAPESYVIGNYDENNKPNHLNDVQVGQWVRMYAQNGNTYQGYKLVEVASAPDWGNPLTGKTHESLSYVYASADNLPTSNVSNGQYAVVGGEEYLYDGSTWVKASEATSTVNWSAIKFNYWKGSITTAILPPNVVASDLNGPWDGLKEDVAKKLTKVQSGDTYADITWGSPNAKIYAKSEEECTRLKEILRINNFIDQNNFQQEINDGNYIKWNETTQVYDVHVTSAGSFTRLFSQNNYPDGAIFRFESDCANFTAADLQMMASETAKYYVDLYDVTTSTDVETVIADAISSMRSSNKQFRGLLLPKNPTTVGTTLIQDEQQGPGSKATCSEFIAYNNQTVTMAHIYADNPANPGDNNTYEDRLTKLKAIMDAHVDNEGKKVIEEATSIYAVSTNKPTEITNVNVIKGSHNATVIHIYNNEMVKNATEPSMDVFSAQGNDFYTAVNSTNIKNTANLYDLKFNAPVTDNDILAVNQFTSGPKVLDLSAIPASQITRGLLNSLTNTAIEYIILPAGMDEPVVGDYANLTNLKCVISSNKSTDSEHVLNAYVKVAGSLAEARCLATGNSVTNAGEYKPTPQNLTSIKLAGNLNANDIGTGDGKGLKGEQSTVTSIDLSDAYFENVNDMILGSKGAGLTALTKVKLPIDPADPTAPRMTEIPSHCLYGIPNLQNLHIPYNYKKIGYAAFVETSIDHITTEDASHVLIDNGSNSYTFSANIEEIGEDRHQEGEPTFPQTVRIKDVYCLGAKAPKCYQATFPAQILAGNGGANAGIYCLDKYQGMGEGEKCFALLHFPSLESYTNATGEKDASYDKMVAHYTDPTRAYTKKDQTGAVDANGNPLTWPDQGELYQTYTMAKGGHIWKDYPNPSYEGDDYHLTNFGTANGGPHDVTNESDPYSFRPYYTGWHEFVLSMASYVDPNEIVDHEDIVRYYEEAGWYTFCIPFDMTVSQVQEMLGVPASDPTNHIVCKYIENDGTYKVVDGTTVPAKMPEIRQLTKVTRKKGSGSQSNQVRFILTRDLYNNGSPLCLTFDHEQTDPKDVITRQSAGVNSNGDPICLKGGHPYLIKAYKRVNPEDADEFKIKGQNLGKYILTRYTDEFNKEASCVNRNECMEQLGNENLITLQFARPFEEHKVQAFRADDENTTGYETYDGTKKYNYTMVGQFWQQDLPQYCIYMSHGSWYRYTNTNLKYKWDPYKCIIMATPEIEKADVTQGPDPQAEGYQNVVTEPSVLKAHHMGGKFRNFITSKFPTVQDGTTDRLNNDFELRFVNGRDDDDFNQTSSQTQNAKYIFGFEDGITEFDGNGDEVTAIKTLDGVDLEAVFAKGKVYNMSGQYVGNTLNGLSKGMYIMNGKKYVVK